MAVTVQDLKRNKHRIRLFCDACSRTVLLDPDELEVPDETSVLVIAKHARCTQCGHLGGTAQIVART